MNDIGRRLRDVERRALKLPPGADPLQTFENGSPLGDTRFLDFGDGLLATLIGDDYVRVTGVGGGGEMAWDAIVDATFVTSDPDNRKFIGIGEALTYLKNTVGLTSNAAIVVRTHGQSRAAGTGTYTETVNFDTPLSVTIYGIRLEGSAHTGLADDQFVWDWNGFRPTAAFNLRIEHANLTPGTCASGGAIKPFGLLQLNDVRVSFDGWSTTLFMCDDLYAESSSFDVTGNGLRRLAALDCEMHDCDIAVRSTSSGTFEPAALTAGVQLFMTGCRLTGGSSGSAFVNLPIRTDIEINDDPRREDGGGTTGGPITLIVLASSRNRIRNTHLRFSPNVTVDATAAFTALRLEGVFRDVTATGVHSSMEVSAGRNDGNTWDIRGPCYIACDARAGARFTFRGDGVSGVIAADALTGSGTFLNFVACDYSTLVVGADGTGSTLVAYAFNATSDNNCLVFQGRSSFTAGTDAGTNNRVLPEGSSPPAGGIAPADADYLVGTANAGLSAEIVVGTTPGGELGGTWASPTVDATHSGSAHTDFIAKTFFAAKGDLIGASANDTPIILTVGTDNFVLVADSTTASGLAWKNITTLLSPDSGWGSITNVTPDKVYDADATTVDELADVLGTLIATLVTKGYLSA